MLISYRASIAKPLRYHMVNSLIQTYRLRGENRRISTKLAQRRHKHSITGTSASKKYHLYHSKGNLLRGVSDLDSRNRKTQEVFQMLDGSFSCWIIHG